jgi:hypothetical protein
MLPIMKDFTAKPRVVEFKIGDEIFRGKPHLAAQTMIDFTLTVESVDQDKATPDDGFRTMMSALAMVMMPESYKRFTEHMKEPPEGADTNGFVVVELPQLTEILEWMMGEYGLRPTGQPSPSSDGPSGPESGTSSTVTTSDVESISATSPLTGS